MILIDVSYLCIGLTLRLSVVRRSVLSEVVWFPVDLKVRCRCESLVRVRPSLLFTLVQCVPCRLVRAESLLRCVPRDIRLDVSSLELPLSPVRLVRLRLCRSRLW